ncbi:Rib/alpha-like domain-containing protein [Finegoldia sp. P1-F-LR]
MNNKKIFEKIITEKRAKSSNERPKYGLRKLTVGVVSCLLGYMMFMTPNVTLADKVETTPAALEAKVESTKVHTDDEEQPAEENTAKPEKKSAEQFDAQSSKATTPNAQDRNVRAPEVNTEVATASDNEAEKFIAELKAITVKVGEANIDYSKTVANLPEGAKVTANVDTTQKGEKKVQATIEFKDGSTQVVEITVNVVEEKEDALEVGKTTGAEDSKQQAGEDKVGLTEDQKEHAGKSANNWEETIGEDNDYWKAPEGYNKAKNLGGLNNGGMGAFEVNYLGTYTDESGRDVVRLEWKGDSRTSESVWMDKLSLAFKFQKDLFEKIDWDRSYVYSTNKGEQKFLFNNVNAADYQAEFMLSQVTKTYTGNNYELPMNLVLKEGTKISDLGKKDYLVQHRGYDTKYKEVLANFPGTVGTRELNDVAYGQFTRSTVIPLSSNLKSTVIPPNSNKKI